MASKVRRGVPVKCYVCGRTKKPIGRDASPGWSGCRNEECEGWSMHPYPGELWPGETSTDYGYPVSAYGNEVVNE